MQDSQHKIHKINCNYEQCTAFLVVTLHFHGFALSAIYHRHHDVVLKPFDGCHLRSVILM